MLLIVYRFDSVLRRFDQVAVARIVWSKSNLLTALVEQFFINSIDAQAIIIWPYCQISALAVGLR